MPLFEVTVKGRGIRLVVADGEAAGFFRLVRVRNGVHANHDKRHAAERDTRACPRFRVSGLQARHRRQPQSGAPRLRTHFACQSEAILAGGLVIVDRSCDAFDPVHASMRLPHRLATHWRFPEVLDRVIGLDRNGPSLPPITQADHPALCLLRGTAALQRD